MIISKKVIQKRVVKVVTGAKEEGEISEKDITVLQKRM